MVNGEAARRTRRRHYSPFTIHHSPFTIHHSPLMLIIPAIDLRDGKCVRLTQGRRAEVKDYDGEAVEIARGFEEAGARMIHVVDLDGAFADRNSRNRKVVRRIIRSVSIPVQFGGGLRSVTDVQQMIEY